MTGLSVSEKKPELMGLFHVDPSVSLGETLTVIMEMRMVDKILSQLESEMPPLITRGHPRFKEWTGVCGRRMANLDSLGQGPSPRVILGREIAYPREALLSWIAGRLRVDDSQAMNCQEGC